MGCEKIARLTCGFRIPESAGTVPHVASAIWLCRTNSGPPVIRETALSLDFVLVSKVVHYSRIGIDKADKTMANEYQKLLTAVSSWSFKSLEDRSAGILELVHQKLAQLLQVEPDEGCIYVHRPGSMFSLASHLVLFSASTSVDVEYDPSQP